jgi:hypothetical protein
MKNKKGDTYLMSDTLKLIVAAICIIFLLIFAAKLYSIFTAKTKTEQAKATLELIEAKINIVKETSEPITFIINSPKGYYFYVSDGIKTLCLAPPIAFFDSIISWTKNELDTRKGICRVMESNVEIKNKNFGEDIVGIYESIPVFIRKDDLTDKFILEFDAQSTSDLQRFFHKLTNKN